MSLPLKIREDLNQNLETDDSEEALEMCDTNANDSFPHGSNSESSQQRGDGEHLVGDEHEDIVPGESSEYCDDQVKDVGIRRNDTQGGERGEQQGDSFVQQQSTDIVGGKRVDDGACQAEDDDWL